MKSGMKLASSLALVILLCGCAGTITPRIVQSSQASWDGNQQNSGLIGFDAVGNGILTLRAELRYQALVSDYGYRFKPPIQSADGLILTTTNTWLIDAEHLEKFATMNRWRKQAVK